MQMEATKMLNEGELCPQLFLAFAASKQVNPHYAQLQWLQSSRPRKTEKKNTTNCNAKSNSEKTLGATQDSISDRLTAILRRSLIQHAIPVLQIQLSALHYIIGPLRSTQKFLHRHPQTMDVEVSRSQRLLI